MIGICQTLGKTGVFLLGVLASALATKAAAATAPAGWLIEAQAQVSYYNTRLGTYESVSTNVVTTRVNEVKALDVAFDQTIYLAADSFGELAFFIRNTGNVPLEPAIAIEQSLNDDYDLGELTVVPDRNGNGFADPGEAELAPGARTSLAVGAESAFIVRFRTPPVLSEASQATFQLAATDGAAAGAATGTAVISNSGLALEKSASLDEVEAGGTLRYHLRLNNRGSNAVSAYDEIGGSPIVIDGVSTPGILVRDALPLNTRFSAFLSTADFQGLYHLAGEPEHSYTASAPVDPAQVDAIAFFRSGDYPSGFSTDLSFEVTVPANASSGSADNTASTWQEVGADLAELQSNTVRTKVGGTGASLVFIDPDGTEISATGLDTNARLRLSASFCNATSEADTVVIAVSTDPEGDLETVTATETGRNTGIFTSALVPIQRALPVIRGNGVLSGSKNTTARASVRCGGQAVAATLTINSGGFIFDSVSNSAVAGATVIVFDAGGTEVDRGVSDADGFYTLHDVTTAGTYRIAVQHSSGYVFPSQRTLFPGWGRNVHAQASYGATFTTAGAFAGADIPLDRDGSQRPRLEKSVDESEAAPGDILAYTLTLTNTDDVDLGGWSSTTACRPVSPISKGRRGSTGRPSSRPARRERS